ncbi:MAG: DoxX family membrane protein [Nitriliruptor sp.]|nr:MAG: DoxX family membrane protein [Nitriliruptor sp.]
MDVLTGPDVDAGLLLLRVLVGVTFALHGFQKLFGWFGGGGVDGTAGWFASLGFGSGRSAALMAGAGELAGGLGLAAGLLTPLAAAAMAGTMTTAALVNNAEAGFWSVNKGWELNGYLIVVAAAVAVTGPGAYSLDHLLGLQQLAGPVVGIGAVLVGVVGGWLRWATRDRAAEGG